MIAFLNEIDLTSPTAGVFPTARVGATEAALDVLGALRHRHGAISLHHAGGCLDGIEPVCLAQGVLRIGTDDRCLGEIDGVPVYVCGPGSEDWEDRQFILDIVAGNSAGFSLIGATGKRFLTRSRPFAADDRRALGLPPI